MSRPTYEQALAMRDRAQKAHEDQTYKKAGNKLHARCHALTGALLSGECSTDPRVFVTELVGYLYEYEDATGENFPSLVLPKEKADLANLCEELEYKLSRAEAVLKEAGLEIPEEPKTKPLEHLSEDQRRALLNHLLEVEARERVEVSRYVNHAAFELDGTGCSLCLASNRISVYSSMMADIHSFSTILCLAAALAEKRRREATS